jgi:hypothetical protein
VFVRQTEEVFGSYLWGPDASKVLHYHLFYHGHGRVMSTFDMSNIMGELTLKHLKVELNVSTYRHLAAALGRHLMVGIIDPEEDLTTGMDAMAGRQTVTSEAIYGLQPGEVGRVNDRVMTLFRAMARLWHARVLGLKLEGRVATLNEILHRDSTEETLKGTSSSASSPFLFDLDTLVSVLKTVFEDSVVGKIVPALIKALEEKMADKVFREEMVGGRKENKGDGDHGEDEEMADLYLPNPFSEDSTVTTEVRIPMLMQLKVVLIYLHTGTGPIEQCSPSPFQCHDTCSTPHCPCSPTIRSSAPTTYWTQGNPCRYT